MIGCRSLKFAKENPDVWDCKCDCPYRTVPTTIDDSGEEKSVCILHLQVFVSEGGQLTQKLISKFMGVTDVRIHYLVGQVKRKVLLTLANTPTFDEDFRKKCVDKLGINEIEKGSSK